MIIDKLKEDLLRKKRYVDGQLNESKAMYSFNYGRLFELNDILEWINELPDEETIEKLLIKIVESNCIDTYSYNSFNYYELKQLKEIL